MYRQNFGANNKRNSRLLLFWKKKYGILCMNNHAFFVYVKLIITEK